MRGQPGDAAIHELRAAFNFSNERDRIFQYGDVRVFVDPKSFIYLHGMTLDYQETLMQQSFVFVNPNASKSCGCGTSFS